MVGVRLSGSIRRWLVLVTVNVVLIVALLIVGMRAPQKSSATLAGTASPTVMNPPRWPAGTVIVELADGSVEAVDPQSWQVRKVPVPDPWAVLAVPDQSTPFAGAVLVTDPSVGAVAWLTPAGQPVGEIDPGGSPITALFAPTGTPGAGSILSVDSGLGVATRIDPNGQVGLTAAIGANPIEGWMAPPGTPNAGTAYTLSQGDGQANPSAVAVLKPGSSQISVLTIGPGASELAGVGAGSANAGHVYVGSPGDPALTEIDPAGKMTSIKGFRAPAALAVTPAGAATAGRLWVLDDDTIKTVDPSGTVTTVRKDSDIPTAIVVSGASEGLAGTAFIGHAQGDSLLRITPDGQATIIKVGARPSVLALAPARTPDAGTIYSANAVGHSISGVAPGASVAKTISLSGVPIALQVLA